LLPDFKVVHEVELGILIGMTGKNIQREHALDHVAGYFLAIDFTNRGLGLQYKKDGAPWCLMKGSDGFSAISDFIDKEMIPDPSKVALELKNNGQVVQSGLTSEMIMPIAE
jgi:acylpyruvate hydrolase